MGKKANKSGLLRPAERWAIGITVLVLALTLGFHLGTARRVPELRVQTELQAPEERQERATDAEAEPHEAVERIDLNRATAEELATLRGIGPTLAGRIVAYREEHGPFARLEDLTLVDGIGSTLLEENLERLYVGEAEQ